MNFDIAFDRLMGHEGGYVNDPEDPGGETKWGVSKRSYPDEDIPNMTQERAKVIFRRDFWDRVKADKLADGVAWQASDFAYNSGPDIAVRKLQSAVGVSDDGRWGLFSEAAAAKMSESDTIMRLLARRLRYIRRLRNWPQHGGGWVERIANNLDYGAEDSE